MAASSNAWPASLARSPMRFGERSWSMVCLRPPLTPTLSPQERGEGAGGARGEGHSTAARGVPRPRVGLSWEMRSEMEGWGEPKSADCWAAV